MLFFGELMLYLSPVVKVVTPGLLLIVLTAFAHDTRAQAVSIRNVRRAGDMNSDIGRIETSCGGQIYCGGSGTGLRPGSSLSSTCSVAGSSSLSTTPTEAEAGTTSGFCSAPALLSWALWAGEADGADNPRGTIALI